MSKFPSRAKRIDVISRFIFPLIFAIFNLAYWLYYLFAKSKSPQLEQESWTDCFYKRHKPSMEESMQSWKKTWVNMWNIWYLYLFLHKPSYLFLVQHLNNRKNKICFFFGTCVHTLVLSACLNVWIYVIYMWVSIYKYLYINWSKVCLCDCLVCLPPLMIERTLKVWLLNKKEEPESLNLQDFQILLLLYTL